MNLKSLAILATCLSLLGCAGLIGPTPSSPEAPPPATTASLIAAGEFAQAAALALDSAASTSGMARIDALETACWAAARAEHLELLGQALALYPEVTLSPEQRASFDTYQALLLALEEQAAAALRSIRISAQPERSRPQSDYWLTQAMAYRLLDDGEAATLMLVRRGTQLEPDAQLENHARIWQLQLDAARFLIIDPQIRYDATTQGWLELGRIARRFWTDEVSLSGTLNQWTIQFPGHPATAVYWPLAGEIALTTLRSAVRRIGLLLPLTGRLAGAATAVRDGFLAAHFAAESQQLDIRVYDSSNAIDSYEQAVADGAQLIVGPLDKQQVESVISRNGGRLPILALNYRDPGAPPAPAVLEYGLSPEDDARSAALQAMADGHTHAIALVSDDDWGQRSLAAFSQAFTEAGGTLVDSRFFHGGPKDYPSVIKDLLKLDESRARSAAIARLVGEELDTQPVRRQDAQFLFLAASPKQGRQLRPQFRFYHATDLPIYSGGRIYAGTPDPRLDKDLNEIKFCAMPWLLDGSETWNSRRLAIEAAWPQRARRYQRLFAMGNDAYLLASALRNANWLQLPPIAGATGTLTQIDQRIVRTLPCAQFIQGEPRTQTES